MDIAAIRRSSASPSILARQGGYYANYSLGIAVDGKGNSYLTGLFKHFTVFGNTTLIGAGYEMFVASLDAKGQSHHRESAAGGHLRHQA